MISMDNHLANHCASSCSMQPNGHNGGQLRPSLAHSSSHTSPSQGSSSLGNHHPPMATSLFPANRILSRNSNGTIAMTFQPTNESELQLYRVLQRSNLLSYYDTFISQGGDDVQQLCDAGEEEFLEIMALVGMANKPLHVRRLQKALQEWVSNPAMFQAPLTPSFASTGGPSGPLGPHPSLVHHGMTLNPSGLVLTPHSTGPPPSLADRRNSPVNLSSQTPTVPMNSLSSHSLSAAIQSLALRNSSPSAPSSSPASASLLQAPHLHSHPHSSTASSLAATSATGRSQSTPSPTEAKETATGGNMMPATSMPISINHAHIQTNHANLSGMASALVTNEYGQPASPISLTPVLVESQIQRLAETAESMVRRLSPMDSKDPKITNNKKKYAKELEIISMADDDPRRMEEIRKYAVIYGRFDCKRDSAKPLTLHEVSVNEAAIQICKLIPSFLIRRDELFALARQVVRESGYQYSKGHSRSQGYIRLSDGTSLDSLGDSLLDQDSSCRYGKRRLTDSPDHTNVRQSSMSDSPVGHQNSARQTKRGHFSESPTDQSGLLKVSKRYRLAESPANLQERIQYTQEERKRRQERLENVIEQLKTLGSQQEALKLQLQQAREVQNFSQVNQFQSELDQLSTQQMQLINERSEIDKQLRKLERYQSVLNRGFTRISDEKGDTDDTDSQYSVYSNDSSPSVSQELHVESPGQDCSQNSDNFSRALPAKKAVNNQASNPITRQLVRETLMDEGLRVVKEFATQNKDDASNGMDLRISTISSTGQKPFLDTLGNHSNRSTPNNNQNNGNGNSTSMAGSMAAINAVTSGQTIGQTCNKSANSSPRPRGRPPKGGERDYLGTTNGNGNLPYQAQQGSGQSTQLNVSNGFASSDNQQSDSSSCSSTNGDISLLKLASQNVTHRLNGAHGGSCSGNQEMKGNSQSDSGNGLMNFHSLQENCEDSETFLAKSEKI